MAAELREDVYNGLRTYYSLKIRGASCDCDVHHDSTTGFLVAATLETTGEGIIEIPLLDRDYSVTVSTKLEITQGDKLSGWLFELPGYPAGVVFVVGALSVVGIAVRKRRT
jgi:hypothetical protein